MALTNDPIEAIYNALRQVYDPELGLDIVSVGLIYRLEAEGDRVKMLPRTDDNAVWTGSVTLVDYENPAQSNENDRYMGMSSDEMTSASKYPFYVALDSTDGLAAAVCHFYNSGGPSVDKSYSGWDAFVKNNPKKIKSNLLPIQFEKQGGNPETKRNP